jgi:anti-anti-sigma factor
VPSFGLNITRGAGAGGRTVRIAVEGELDSACSLPLVEAFQEVVSQGGIRELTLDLARVQFIDSTGLRTVIQIQQDATRREVPLVVVPAGQEVTHLLQLAGAAQHLRLVDDGQTPPARPDFLERADIEYPRDEQAPSRARAAVRELLGQTLEQSALFSAVLMTSELVSNAVLHPPAADASSLVGVRVSVFSDRVRVEVDDPGQGFDPSMRGMEQTELPSPDQGGRGLFVVDRCATRWGIRRLENDRGSRFSVWFEIESA